MDNTITVLETTASGETWEPMLPGGDMVHVDIAIAAYLDGVSAGRKQEREEAIATLKRMMSENKQRSAELALEVVEILKENNIPTFGVCLRVRGLTECQMLVVVSDNDFSEDAFDKVYESVWELERKVGSNTFRPIIHFLPAIQGDENTINRDMLSSDGYKYWLRYEH